MSTSQTPAPGSFRLPLVAHARVADAMHPGVISCGGETPLREVARIMSTKHIHCLVVTDEEPTKWSVISGLDLAGAASLPFEGRTAVEFAATEPLSVSADESLDRAAQLMLEHRVEHLIVTDARGAPVGVLSSLDIAGVMAWGEA